MPPRLPLSHAQITAVVDAFYEKVRRDPTLGPVFAVHVKDWPRHEDKIARFWRNAILQERVYDGNPMQKHRTAGNVEGAHFALWLQIFDQTLTEMLPPEVARAWSDLAHRIGRSLQMGLSFQKPTHAEVPQL